MKKIYSELATHYNVKFKRNHDSRDGVNSAITLSNYYCYGLAASTLWSLGIPFSMPVIHGKTRNGGLVFDLADIIKSSVTLDVAFCMHDLPRSEFKSQLSDQLDRLDSFKYLFKSLITTIEEIEDI